MLWIQIAVMAFVVISYGWIAFSAPKKVHRLTKEEAEDEAALSEIEDRHW